MRNEALGHARQCLEYALDRARGSGDAELKRQWLELVEAWRAEVASLETADSAPAGGGARPPKGPPRRGSDER